MFIALVGEEEALPERVPELAAIELKWMRSIETSALAAYVARLTALDKCK